MGEEYHSPLLFLVTVFFLLLEWMAPVAWHCM